MALLKYCSLTRLCLDDHFSFKTLNMSLVLSAHEGNTLMEVWENHCCFLLGWRCLNSVWAQWCTFNVEFCLYMENQRCPLPVPEKQSGTLLRQQVYSKTKTQHTHSQTFGSVTHRLGLKGAHVRGRLLLGDRAVISPHWQPLAVFSVLFFSLHLLPAFSFFPLHCLSLSLSFLASQAQQSGNNHAVYVSSQ